MNLSSYTREKMTSFERALKFLLANEKDTIKLDDTVRIEMLKIVFENDSPIKTSMINNFYNTHELHESHIFAATMVVSQPNYNMVRTHMSARESRNWLSGSVKILRMYKKSPEFTWDTSKKDVRKFIDIHTKYGTVNSIQSCTSTAS